MLLWGQPDDGLGFEDLLKLEDDREPIAAETPAATYPCGSPWPQESAGQKARDLSQRLAREQQTTQRLIRLLDEAGHDAARWRTRAVTRLGFMFVVGAACGLVVGAAWWWING